MASPGSARTLLRGGAGYFWACLAVAAVTAIGAPLAGELRTATVALALLLVVVFVADVWGLRPALLASMLAVLAFDYFFLPPFGTLDVANPQDWVALGAFLVTAVTVGQLSDRAKRRAAAAEAGRKEARRESDYNRALIEASLDPAVAIAIDGSITDANAAMVMVTGRSRDELVGTPFADCFTNPAQARAAYERAFAQGSVRDLPLEVRAAAGAGIPLVYNVSVYRAAGGEVEGVLAVARDLSALAHAEREIRRLASFPQRSPVPIVEFDTAMQVRFMNESMKRTLQEYGIGDPRMLIPPAWATKLARVPDADEAGVSEVEVAGHSFHEQISYSKEFRTLRVWAVDMTERKNAERALQRLNRTLRTLSNANQALVRATTEPELLQEMCRVLVDAGGFRMAWIGLAEHDEAKTVRTAAIAGADEGYVARAKVSWADDEHGRGPTGTAIRTGAPQINRDFATDPRMGPWRAEALKRGYRSSVALPLRDASAVIGALTIYAPEPDAFGKEELALFEELAGDLAYGIGALRAITDREAMVRQLRESLEDTVGAIASTVEARDPYTAGHQRRVAQLASGIGREMGLPEDQIRGIFLAGLIHDVGKIHVPAEILTKPGELTPLEMQLVRVHAQAGYDIIKGIEFPWPVAQAVVQHHERLDGSGYPKGLAASAICVEARVLAVADVVETMMSHRPYRPARGLEIALAEIRGGKGRLYDAAAVDACIALFASKAFRFQ